MLCAESRSQIRFSLALEDHAAGIYDLLDVTGLTNADGESQQDTYSLKQINTSAIQPANGDQRC